MRRRPLPMLDRSPFELPVRIGALAIACSMLACPAPQGAVTAKTATGASVTVRSGPYVPPPAPTCAIYVEGVRAVGAELWDGGAREIERGVR